MSYCTQSDIEALIPPDLLTAALDDDRDGNADNGLLATILDAASNAVDSYLQGLYSVPFATPPALCKQAAIIFAAEMLYARRQSGEDRNPMKQRADGLRTHLEQLRDGKLILNAADEDESTGATGGNDVVAIRIR